LFCHVRRVGDEGGDEEGDGGGDGGGDEEEMR
jgi:hypothetical protein